MLFPANKPMSTPTSSSLGKHVADAISYLELSNIRLSIVLPILPLLPGIETDILFIVISFIILVFKYTQALNY